VRFSSTAIPFSASQASQLASELSDNELYAPRPVPGLTSGRVNPKEQRNTLEMTRTILKNAGGEEKSVDELRQLIRTTYGIEPAKSLDQMLYKRASAGRGFYKTTGREVRPDRVTQGRGDRRRAVVVSRRGLS
jgi:hypothetical protein